MSSPAPTVKPLRRDAAANRDRVIAAAKEVFASHGLDAGVEEVARAAGVGMGTLYRRFATKQALIDELVGAVRLDLVGLARDAAAMDGGAGLETLLVAVGELQEGNTDCLTQMWNKSDAEPEAMREFRALLAALLGTAQLHRRVRPEVTVTDISLLMRTTGATITGTRQVAPGAWRRQLELFVAGLRPADGPRLDATLRHPPMTPAQLARLTTPVSTAS